MNDFFKQLHLWETETSTDEPLSHKQTSPLTVNMSARLKEQFQATCSQKHTNMTEVVNQLIKKWLEEK